MGNDDNVSTEFQFNGFCCGEFNLTTNGKQGGDAGHGAYMNLSFKDIVGTCTTLFYKVFQR